MSLKYKGQNLVYGPNDAKYVDYDNTESGLSAGNIQNAVDELAEEKQAALTAGNNITIADNTISATDTTYESKSAVSEGTDVSLVTTGEKYTWNNAASVADTVSSKVASMPQLYGAWTTTVPSGTRTITFAWNGSSYSYFKVECFTYGNANYLYIGYGRGNRDTIATVVNGSALTVAYDSSTHTLTITAEGNFTLPILITANQPFTITES